MFYPRWEGVARTALLIGDKVFMVQARYAFGFKDAVRDVPK